MPFFSVHFDPPEPAACPSIAVAEDGSYAWPGTRIPPASAFVAPLAGVWYDAQPFGKNRHLGADLNASDGDDRGDPVFAVATGCVVFAQDIRRGWGNVVRVVHRLADDTLVETLYAHLDRIDVVVGQLVAPGEKLGTVGDAHGAWLPHLHLELRQPGLPQGRGYGTASGHLDPFRYVPSPG